MDQGQPPLATAASAATDGPVPEPVAPSLPAALAFWIRTPCGRAQYLSLAARPGLIARLRLGWFVLIAALRDLGQPLPEERGAG